MTDDSIRIHYFHAQYQVLGTGEDTAATQRRCDRIATDLLTRAWEDWLINNNDSSEALYFVESMEIALSLDMVNLDDRAIAKTWAKALHQDLRRTVRQGGSGITVFRNRSEFVASFLEDLLQGNAWAKWYYQEFEEWRSQSFSQIVLQALTADADTGRDTLIELTQRSILNLLLGNLGDGELTAIVGQCLLPFSPRVLLPNTYSLWIQHLRSLLTSSGTPPTGSLEHNTAWLYLSLLRQRPELGPDVNLARFIHDLLLLGQALRELQNNRRFLELLESDTAAALFAQLGRGSEPQWRAFVRREIGQEEDWISLFRQLGQTNLQQLATLLREVNGREVTGLFRELDIGSNQPATTQLFTPYGGLFLLIPGLMELELYDQLRQSPYPEPEGLPKAELLLFILALQCLGYDNAQRGMRDRGLAIFAGLDALPTLSRLEAYATGLPTDSHTAFRQAFQDYVGNLVRQPYFSVLRSSSTETSVEVLSALALWCEEGELGCDRNLDRSMQAVSWLALNWFSTKLGAFAGSSPAYLRQNFLESQAEVTVSSNRITVCFLTCPLQMVLRMAGFDSGSWVVPWMGGRQLEFRF